MYCIVNIHRCGGGGGGFIGKNIFSSFSFFGQIIELHLTTLIPSGCDIMLMREKYCREVDHVVT